MIIYFAYEALVLDTTGVALFARRCDEYGEPDDDGGFCLLEANMPSGDDLPILMADPVNVDRILGAVTQAAIAFSPVVVIDTRMMDESEPGWVQILEVKNDEE